MKLRHLDLFSGIGGFSLGLESTGGFETVAFCDNELFAQKVLKKHWANVPCFGDIRDVREHTAGLGRIDIVTGGFPCQPYSAAGKQDPEDNRQLWHEMFRVIKEFKPRWVIGENVRNLINVREGLVFEQVCTDLESEGYETQTYLLPASAVNAPHQRYRCWILSYSNSGNKWTREKPKQPKRNTSRQCTSNSSENVPNAQGSRHRRRIGQECRTKEWQFQQSKQRWSEVGSKIERRSKPLRTEARSTEQRMGRAFDGLSEGLDRHWGSRWEEGTPRLTVNQKDRKNRLKSLGNSVIPQIPAVLGRAILKVTQNEINEN
jgi:DNA (cytosine-5)-methyltransferase 1